MGRRSTVFGGGEGDGDEDGSGEVFAADEAGDGVGFGSGLLLLTGLTAGDGVTAAADFGPGLLLLIGLTAGDTVMAGTGESRRRSASVFFTGPKVILEKGERQSVQICICHLY